MFSKKLNNSHAQLEPLNHVTLIPLCHCKFLIMEPPAVLATIVLHYSIAGVPQPKWYKGQIELETRTFAECEMQTSTLPSIFSLTNIIF